MPNAVSAEQKLSAPATWLGLGVCDVQGVVTNWTQIFTLHDDYLISN